MGALPSFPASTVGHDVRTQIDKGEVAPRELILGTQHVGVIVPRLGHLTLGQYQRHLQHLHGRFDCHLRPCIDGMDRKLGNFTNNSA